MGTERPLSSSLSSSIKKNTSKSDDSDLLVRELFDYWAGRRAVAIGKNDGGPPMKATDQRLGKIRARLKEGYTIDQLKAAIDGCLSNPFNVEGGHTDIELICRDQKHVEQYRARAAKGATANGSKPTHDRPELRSLVG